MDAPDATHTRRLRPSDWLLFGGMVLVAASRLAAVQALGDPASDPDGYVSLAANLKQTGVFAPLGGGGPTAFRPPLYPAAGALNAAATSPRGAAERIAVAHRSLIGVNALAALATFLLAWLAARTLGFAWPAVAAVAVLVAGSPLAIAYAAQPMTEVFCGGLLAAAVLLAVWMDHAPGPKTAAAFGLAAGLACLCRPTCFVPAAGWGVWLLWRAWRREGRPVPWAAFAIAAVVGLATLAPWAVWNYRVFRRPIVTTTHGGYTLLLGNNDAFYDQVVRQPWGTVWSGEQLAAWSDGLQAEMAAAGVEGELARDAYQKAKAVETIRRRPGDFVRACVLRVARFWNVVPQGPAADRLPRVAYYAVGLFYAGAWLLAAVGVVAAWRGRMGAMVAVAIPAVAFTAVHAVYWSNARMRLPVEPCVFLFAGLGAEAACGWTLRGQRRKASEG